MQIGPNFLEIMQKVKKKRFQISTNIANVHNNLRKLQNLGQFFFGKIFKMMSVQSNHANSLIGSKDIQEARRQGKARTRFL